MMYNICNRHPLVCVSRLMFALQLYIIQQRVSLFCAKFRICSFIVRRKNTVMEGRFAGRTWKLAGIAKFVLQLGQQSKTREETKICSHR